MHLRGSGHHQGFDALRRAVAEVLLSSLEPRLAPAAGPSGSAGRSSSPFFLASDAMVRPHHDSLSHGVADGPAHATGPGRTDGTGDTAGGPADDLKVSSVEDEAEAGRLIALVDLAKAGDTDAFGLLYDHYQPSVYRFLYYRVGSVVVAEDLTSETFFRALRSMSTFTWQGKDFGAWLMTIARNLTMDHFKSSKTRLEMTTEDMSPHDSTTESPESAVLAHLTNEALMTALRELPTEQQECLVMRFLQGLSIAETAAALGRSDGAVKQLQLRGVRNLAKLMPEGLR
jgi:RNA polymerase sigma-70 factor (ECF subfamily)